MREGTFHLAWLDFSSQPHKTIFEHFFFGRHPSLVQLVAIPPSVIMVLMGQAKSWYANEPEQSLMEDIKRHSIKISGQ